MKTSSQLTTLEKSCQSIFPTDKNFAISILILTKDRENQLEKCLNSLKHITEEILEIIVLENGSENSLSRSFKDAHPQVRFFNCEKNIGVAAGRNKLAEKARGDLFWFLDDDAQLISQDAPQKMRRIFQEDSKLGLVSFKIINQFTGSEEARCIPNRHKRPTIASTPAVYFAGCSFVIKKDVFIRSEGFWELLYYSGEEIDLSYRILRSGYKIISSADLLVQHAYEEKRERNRSWIFFNTRNRPWLALRHLPWICVISHLGTWWLFAGWNAFKNGEIFLFFKAIIESLIGFKEVLKMRKRLPPALLREIYNLGGRYWY